MSIRTESIKRVLRIEGRVPEETSCTFVSNPESKAFHCNSCGGFMFYRKLKIFSIVTAGFEPELFFAHIKEQCRKCGHIYNCNIV